VELRAVGALDAQEHRGRGGRDPGQAAAGRDRAKEALVDFRQTLASVDRLATGLGADDGSFNRLLLQLKSAAVRVEAVLDEAKVGATTASLRDTTGQVGQAAVNVSDAREELQASLVALRETLESVRALADALARDPSVVLRGPPVDRIPAPTGR